MINVRGNKKKVNKATNNFVDTKALYNSPQFTDGVAGVNNVKKIKNKIALPEEFTAEKVSKPINEQVEYLKSEKPLHVNDKKAITIEKKLLKSFRVDPSTADRLDHEIYKYENQLAQQKQQAVSLWDDVVNRSQQYIKLFEGVASNSIFQGMASLAARVIAPPPTPEETKVIMDRLKALDPSLITDVYTISKIVQSPELLAYLKNLYEHVKNNVATNKDLQYIINIVKPIVDYIAINSDHFSMNGSPWLMEAYNKIKGSPFNSPMFAPGTASPVPVQTSDTNYNFQTNPTAPPMERHTDAPTAAPTPATAGFIRPETSAPTQPTAGVIRPPLASSQPFYDPELSRVVESYYNLAFTDFENLKYFYNSLITTEGTNTNRATELLEVKKYMIAYNMTNRIENINNASLSQLITPLLNALNSLLTLSPDIKNTLINKGNNIISSNAFFFQQRQTLTPPPQPSESPISSTSTPPRSTTGPRHHQLGSATPMEIMQDLEHLRNRFNEAMTSNITTLKKLYFDILDKKDPIINRYIVLYNTLLRLDNLYEVDADMAPGKIFIINLFNAFNNLNYPGLNDFKQILRNKADMALISPNYQVAGALDIPPIESFTPINYVRPYNVQPSTIAQPYKVEPKLLSEPTNAPVYIAQPTTGPQIAPSPQVITTGAASLIKQTPTKMKVKITKSQATKIIETIINNSTNTTDLINGISQTDEILNTIRSEFNIERGLEIGSMVIAGISLLAAFKKYYSGKKGSREENLRLLSEQDIERDPSIAKDALPIIALDGKSLGVKPTTVGRLIQIGKNLNPISVAHSMFEYARNLMRAGSEEEVRAATERATTELTEINIEPTAGPSEAEAKRRIKEAMAKVKETRIKKKVGEGSGLTQKQKDELIQEENIKLKEEVAQLKAKESERVVKRAAKSVVSNIITEAAVGGVINQIVEQMSVYENRVNAFLNKAQQPREFKTFEKYKTFYDVVQDLSTNIRAILINLGLSETDVFGVPFNALAGQGSTKYNSINDQFIRKDYTTLIKKIQGWLNIIGPLMNQNDAFNKLYYVILNMQSVINKNHMI
jgi:hypothetical protein